MSETEDTRATPTIDGALTIRPERSEDEAFLYRVYASTRTEEMALTGWNASTCEAFLQMQFKAMRRGYAEQFPKADFSILLRSGRSVGRMVVDRTADIICLVDLAILPEFRGQGTGTALMKEVLAEAVRVKKPIHLHVFKQTRPLGWYARLGFRKIGDSGAYDRLEWRPGAS
jgi:ribosomal protein S18 acetylase RimI-like enzyme